MSITLAYSTFESLSCRQKDVFEREPAAWHRHQNVNPLKVELKTQGEKEEMSGGRYMKILVSVI